MLMGVKKKQRHITDSLIYAKGELLLKFMMEDVMSVATQVTSFVLGFNKTKVQTVISPSLTSQ